MMEHETFVRYYRFWQDRLPQQYQRECNRPVRVLVVARNDDHNARLAEAGALQRAGIEPLFFVGWEDRPRGMFN